jgi:hypothetical protein
MRMFRIVPRPSPCPLSAFSDQLSAFSDQLSAISIQQSAFLSPVSCPLSAFSIQRSAISIQRSAFSIQRSAISVQQSAISIQQSAFILHPFNPPSPIPSVHPRPPNRGQIENQRRKTVSIQLSASSFPSPVPCILPPVFRPQNRIGKKSHPKNPVFPRNSPSGGLQTTKKTQNPLVKPEGKKSPILERSTKTSTFRHFRKEYCGRCHLLGQHKNYPLLGNI